MIPNLYKAGDVVRLVSGGPSMTVAGTSNGVVKCVWYNEALSKIEVLRIAQALLTKPSILG